MATVIPPDAPPYEQLPANGRTFDLPELQGLVGGYIEGLRTSDGGWLFLNEDGKGKGLAFNILATQLMRGRIGDDDYIVGTCVLCSPREAGEGDL